MPFLVKIQERNIEQRANEYAETLGYYHNKQNGLGNKGKPDRVYVNLVGEHIYIEFKRPGEALDRLQWVHARELARRGCVVYECCHIRHAQRILDNHARPGAEPVDGRITYEMAAAQLRDARIELDDADRGGSPAAGPRDGKD